MHSGVDGNGWQSSSVAFGIVQREWGSDTSVIAVEGDLDLATAPRLKSMLAESLDAGRTALVLDFSLVTFMDSTTLGVLVGVARGLEPGARLAIVCVRPNVLKIFEFAGLDGAFAIFATLEQALVYVGEKQAWAS